MLIRPLEYEHWPPPQRCPQCGLAAAYRAGQITWCTSLLCDPQALTFVALDRYYRRQQRQARRARRRRAA